MKEPQPPDSQNRIIEPSDLRIFGLSIHYLCTSKNKKYFRLWPI